MPERFWNQEERGSWQHFAESVSRVSMAFAEATGEVLQESEKNEDREWQKS